MPIIGPPIDVGSSDIEQNQNAQHEDWTAVRSFVRSEGKAQIPVMGPDGTPCEIVQLHAPVESIIWAWTASKIGEPPTAPSPNLVDPTKILLSSSIGSAVATPHPSGGHVWTLSGTYTYALQQPYGVMAPIPTGKMPWETNKASDNTIPDSYFQDGLLGD